MHNAKIAFLFCFYLLNCKSGYLLFISLLSGPKQVGLTGCHDTLESRESQLRVPQGRPRNIECLNYQKIFIYRILATFESILK